MYPHSYFEQKFIFYYYSGLITTFLRVNCVRANERYRGLSQEPELFSSKAEQENYSFDLAFECNPSLTETSGRRSLAEMGMVCNLLILAPSFEA